MSQDPCPVLLLHVGISADVIFVAVGIDDCGDFQAVQSVYQFLYSEDTTSVHHETINPIRGREVQSATGHTASQEEFPNFTDLL